MAFTVIEQYAVGKFDDPERCEDALAVTPHFAAIVDGATSKTSFRFSGRTPGRVAASLLVRLLADLPADADCSAFIARANEMFVRFYREHRLLDRARADASCRLTASAVVYSDARREVWSVGDCRLRIGGGEYRHEKAIDTLLSSRRAEAIESYLAQGGEPDALFVRDVGREAIREALLRQYRAQNPTAPDTPFAYGVLDGFPPYAPDVRSYAVEAGQEVVLASDGYPAVLPTLEESERRLRQILHDDPHCFRIFKSTKGVMQGQTSFDDRAYLRLRAE